MKKIIDLREQRKHWALFPEPERKEEQQKETPASTQPSLDSSRRGGRGEQEKPAEEQKTEIVWQAPEYIYYPKSSDWYWAVGIISLALVLIAIFTGNFLFAIFAVVAGFTVALWGARKPKIVVITLDGKGVSVELARTTEVIRSGGTRLYHYQELVSFWIHYNPPLVKEINFITKNTFLPHLRVPIGNENPAEIRAFLVRFLPEKMQEESLIDIIARVLKF